MIRFSTKEFLIFRVCFGIALIFRTDAQVAPGPPVITSPDIIMYQQTVTLTCTVIGGSPAPTVKWVRDDQVIDDTFTFENNAYVNRYTFTATQEEHLEVFECQSENGVLQDALTTTIYVRVYRTPSIPTLTGPSSVISGTSNQWTCTSLLGFPAPTMQMRVGNSVFQSNQVTVTSQLENKSYRVTGTLIWSPSTANNGQTLHCDVFHPETLGANNPQTVSLQLNVQSSLAVTAPVTSYNPVVGSTLSINCVVTSGTATGITWYKNNQLVVLANNMRLSGGSPSSPSLVISQVQTGDAGTYQCQASDSATSVRTNVITVTVQDLPVTEEEIITSILNGYNKLVRPTPLPRIEHSMHPKRILDCDGKTLIVQGWVCMFWYDSRLTWPRGQNSVSLPSSYIWLPDVTQHGGKPDFYTAPVWSAEKAVVTKEGRVGFCPQGIFTTNDCIEKAGEKHQCTMKFRSWSYDKELMDIILPTNREAVDISGLEIHTECEIVNKCSMRNERTYACCGSRLYPDVTYTLVWQRKRNYCVNLMEQPTCNA